MAIAGQGTGHEWWANLSLVRQLGGHDPAVTLARVSVAYRRRSSVSSCRSLWATRPRSIAFGMASSPERLWMSPCLLADRLVR